MKSDVLDTFETIRACVAYEIDGQKVTDFPFEVDDAIKPVYIDLKGWQTDMTKMRKEDEFPAEFNQYLAFLERELGVPVSIVSIGPDRDQTIIRK